MIHDIWGAEWGASPLEWPDTSVWNPRLAGSPATGNRSRITGQGFGIGGWRGHRPEPRGKGTEESLFRVGSDVVAPRTIEVEVGDGDLLPEASLVLEPGLRRKGSAAGYDGEEISLVLSSSQVG